MKNTQTALAVTGGYLVGRRLKMRWALTLAGLMAGRRLLSSQGLTDAGQGKPSELGRLGQELRSELMTVGRSTAVNTISNRMNLLSDSLGERALALRTVPNGQESGEPSRQRDRARGDETEASKGRPSEGRSGASTSKTSSDRPAEREKPTEDRRSGRSQG